MREENRTGGVGLAYFDNVEDATTAVVLVNHKEVRVIMPCKLHSVYICIVYYVYICIKYNVYICIKYYCYNLQVRGSTVKLCFSPATY